MLVNWDDYSQYMEQCYKPPTRVVCIVFFPAAFRIIQITCGAASPSEFTDSTITIPFFSSLFHDGGTAILEKIEQIVTPMMDPIFGSDGDGRKMII